MTTPETTSAGASKSFFDQLLATANTAGNIYKQIKDAKNAPQKTEPANTAFAISTGSAKLLLVVGGVVAMAIVAWLALRK
jgi:NAD/NADP transhydrogenase alpha subunit